MDLHQKVRKDLPGGVHDSEFTSFGSAAVPPWWGVNVSENVILKFSSVLEDIQESATQNKTTAVPKKSSDSSARIAPQNRRALNYLLAEQGGAVANTTGCA